MMLWLTPAEAGRLGWWVTLTTVVLDMAAVLSGDFVGLGVQTSAWAAIIAIINFATRSTP